MNKLRQVTMQVKRLSPAEAEVWLLIETEIVTPTTQVRSRLIGPRCAGATTIEVAYPLQTAPPQEGIPPLSQRAVIPDPSLWEPDRPFVYHALIELWQDGKLCDQTEADYGLRMGGKHSQGD
jgi:beta-galactosidase/beta-glucuronidase